MTWAGERVAYPRVVASVIGSSRRAPDSIRDDDRFARWWIGAIVVLTVAVTVAYAVAGTNFVLDDWFTLRNAHFDGAWAAAGDEQRVARPGAWLTYALVFGLIGRHPLPVLLLQGALALGTALLLFSLLRRFFAVSLAGTAAALWVLLPNHTSLEVWASASNIALSVFLLVAGGLLLASPRLDRTRCAAVGLVFAGSVLSYEATLPVAAAAALVLPWVVGRRLRWDAVTGAAIGLGAAALWIVSHWHPAKSVSREVADLTQMLGAHLGWGVAPDGPVADVLLLVGLAGIGVAVARVALPSLRSAAGPEEWAVVAGVVVVVLGTLPFALYLYAPLGAGDRFNAVSSLGGALAWAGILAMAWRAHRAIAVTGLAVLVGAAVVARVERVLRWSDAGADAVAILDGVRRTIPEPTGTIVIGPTPIQQDNVAAFLDQSNIDAAVQLEYDDRSVRGGITFSQAQFDEIPPDRRFDIREVSRLEGEAPPPTS
jgi:hypothetical protein